MGYPEDGWISNVLQDIVGPSWQSKPSRASCCRFMIVCFVPTNILSAVPCMPSSLKVAWEQAIAQEQSYPPECVGAIANKSAHQVFIGKDWMKSNCIFRLLK